jgi:hypothetical protein
MRHSIYKTLLLVIVMMSFTGAQSQTIQYTMPEETEDHDGTWIQWPHNYLYGPW